MDNRLIICYSPIPDFGILWEEVNLDKPLDEPTTIKASRAKRLIEERGYKLLKKNEYGLIYGKEGAGKDCRKPVDPPKADSTTRLVFKTPPGRYGKCKELIEAVRSMRPGDCLWFPLTDFTKSSAAYALKKGGISIFQQVDEGNLYLYK